MNIEALDKTIWDVVIVGTGLRESLLAAALARAGKRILHLDRNPYYGNEYAALSLDELETWAKSGAWNHLTSVEYKTYDAPTGSSLKKSRSYTLSLSPGLLYTTSPVLSLLVKSNLHESLEFLKVGSWFVYDAASPPSDPLKLVPNSREDIFNDKTLDPRTKRVVVRALKSIAGLEGSPGADTGSNQISLLQYLENPPFRLPHSIIAAFTSLTLCHDVASQISLERAQKAIKKHFDSLGRFGAGFSAVIGRYGSGSELVQVLCRAAAVTGNAIYVLGNEVVDMQECGALSPSASDHQTSPKEQNIRLLLKSGDVVRARHVVGAISSLPNGTYKNQPSSDGTSYWMSLYLVSSSLAQIFRTNEPPSAAGAVIYLPTNSIKVDACSNIDPIYVVAHSSDTGECPDGQSILYLSMKGGGSNESEILDAAVNSLLQKLATDDSPDNRVLASLKYRTSSGSESIVGTVSEHVHFLPDHIPITEIPDSVVEQVLVIYEKILGSRDAFLEKLSFEGPEAPQEESE